MHITLTEQEGAQLSKVLSSYLSDLRMEIAGTDRLEFREGLKEEEVFLKRLLKQLETATAS